MAGTIASGFGLGAHELVEITPPAGAVRAGVNSIGFHVPRFPEECDAYVRVHELTVDVAAAG